MYCCTYNTLSTISTLSQIKVQYCTFVHPMNRMIEVLWVLHSTVRTLPYLKQCMHLEPPEYENYYLSLSLKTVKIGLKLNKMLV